MSYNCHSKKLRWSRIQATISSCIAQGSSHQIRPVTCHQSKQQNPHPLACWVPGPVHVSCIACIVGVARKNLTPKSKVTNERFGTSSHPLQNGMLTHPQDFDAPLQCVLLRRARSIIIVSSTRTIRTSFLPAIVSTSTRMHGEFLASSFSTGPPGDRGALPTPLECHRSNTTGNRSSFAARPSTRI
jgi:hypothetical protein